jgi:amino acid adenylation domain-containing protein
MSGLQLSDQQASIERPALPVTASDGNAVYEFPCTRAQRRFWLMERLHPGSPALNIAVRWRLVGQIDPALVEEAYIALVRRHEILRTAIVERDGEPVQRVLADVPIEMQFANLTSLPHLERQAVADQITLELARRPFDLAAPPLLRACLLKLDESEFRFLLTLHHAIGDGWSVGLIARDLVDLYEARINPLATGPGPLDLQYADVAVWESETQPGPEIEAGVEYWRQKLAGYGPFSVVTDKPRTTPRAITARIEGRQLPRHLTRAATSWAAEQGASFFALALATLSVVLYRYGNQYDVLMGTQVAGRSHAEMEGVIGPFINTLVLRVDVSGDPAFSTMVDRARETVEGAIGHADTPFEELLDIVRPLRGTQQSPLFQVNFIYQRSFVSDQHRRDFTLLDMPSLSPGPLYDLNFFMVERADGWRLSCEYDTGLYETETISRFLEHFEDVLTTALTAPHLSIGELAVASDTDRATIATWNPPRHELPFEPVHRLVSAQAATTPRARAVLSGTDSLTFARIETLSNQIAHVLIGEGVQPGDLVGICLDRSVMLPVVLLAVLKTGAGYVPLDPEYPAQRLAQMAQDSAFKALITTVALRSRVPRTEAATVLIDADDSLVNGAPSHDPGITVGGDELAYVLFTSGSTGRPKGVQVTHRALTNLLVAMRREPGLAAHDVFVAVTSPSFDIAALELFLPLMVGAKLVIATREETRDGEELLRLLRRSSATCLQATPATWRMLAETSWNGVPRLRMLCGGEPLPRDLAERLLPFGELWNMYGPTETTIWSSVLRVTSGAASIPIGPPIANTTFHVLDQQRRPVPLGAPGELYIGGIGLARGYLGRPDLTEERFIPVDGILPGGDAGERLYRTGDMVRWRNDGSLDFLGRADQQIKLRGFRIELGEIEAVLAADPKVQAAVAALQPGPGGEPRLVAFVVPQGGGGLDKDFPARAQAMLAAALPAYMRPSVIQAIDSLPLTPNGKVDRPALPLADSPEQNAPTRQLDHLERAIAEIWQELLGPVEIGPDSDFFELGGDSIKAARLLSRLGRDYGQVSFSSLLQGPTVARLARLVANTGATDNDPRIVILRSGSAVRPIWGISTTTIFRRLADRLDDQPFYVVRAQDTELAAILACPNLEAIASYYLSAVRRAQPHGPYALLGFCAEAAVAFEMARQLEQMGETVDMLILIDGWAPGYNRRLGPIRGRLANQIYYVCSLYKRLRMAMKSGRLRPVADDLPPPDPNEGISAAGLIHRHIQTRAKFYQPRPFSGRALVVRSTTQPHGPLLDHSLGWNAVIDGGLDIIEVEGDHLSIFAEPGVDTMATGVASFAGAAALLPQIA